MLCGYTEKYTDNYLRNYDDNHVLYHMEQRFPDFVHAPLDDYYRQGNTHTLRAPYKADAGYRYDL